MPPKRGPQTASVGARGKLTPMRVSDGFREFVLDQLAAVPDLRPRQMFGGVGLYSGEVFFGILAADVLYFKVDDANRSEYEAAGSSAFRPYADRPMTMSYYRVPVAVLEDASALATWAERALAVARAKPSSKKPAAKGPDAKRPPSVRGRRPTDRSGKRS
jgi:DNA transformation protein